MVKSKTEKNQFKQSKKKMSQLRLTRLTCHHSILGDSPKFTFFKIKNQKIK
jgi:hypothetical protein